jgi:phenylalanyl-tRNA synthetase alpha chain
MNKEEFIAKLEEIKRSSIMMLESSNSPEELKKFEIEVLGRKSELTNLLRSLAALPQEDRGLAGKAANETKNSIEAAFQEKYLSVKSQEIEYELDITAPGVIIEEGHLHLTTQAIKEVEEIFKRIGFYRRRYPVVEWDYYAFTALNFPDDHPARDEWETFFIDSQNIDPKYGRRLLTPHTSSGQVREMETGQMPIRMINISKCPRRQLDVSHCLVHHQFEGLVIDKNITIANLKGVLNYFVKEFFGPDREVRIRPYDFRFTEPSFEVDVSVPKNSRIGKHGWLEIGGAGMVHPNVLRAGGIDPEIYSGFAFGWGIERNKVSQKGINIEDIRILYQNDIRFLNQF